MGYSLSAPCNRWKMEAVGYSWGTNVKLELEEYKADGFGFTLVVLDVTWNMETYEGKAGMPGQERNIHSYCRDCKLCCLCLSV
uniref:Uncharacterized protein n=1 Tax=Anguilla anguilla TaxID=7936 RepID=A0A0E9RTX5_ANGAN